MSATTASEHALGSGSDATQGSGMQLASPQPAGDRRTRRRVHLPDVLGVAWLVLVAFLFLSPAIKDGPSFGPGDLGATLSTLTSPGLHGPLVHNNLIGDIADQDVAWNTLDWRLVHHGELPLWDSLAGNGLPQLLNFESAPLALPSLVGYLFPLALAFLVTVGMKLLVAGSGAYVLARLLGCRPIAAAFAGTTFMLSGSFDAWLGWAIGGPLAWSGWVVAGCVLAYRGRAGARAKGVSVLALSVAFAVLGGFPETYALMAIGLATLLGAGGVATLAVRRRLDLAGLVRVGCGTAAGLALSSPLWLPGIAVIRQSIRAGRVASTGVPLHFSLLIFAQGYDGLPLQTQAAPQATWIGTSFNYNETAAYVGVVALALAAVAVLVAGWRRPAVIGLETALLVTVLIVYNLGHHAPVQRLITRLGLEGIALQRMLIVLGFCVALLGGLGLELCLSRWRERGVQVAMAAGVLGVCAVLLVMWAKAFSTAVIPEATPAYPNATPISAGSIRRAALWWPSAEAAAMLLGVGALVAGSWRNHGSAGTNRRLAGATGDPPEEGTSPDAGGRPIPAGLGGWLSARGAARPVALAGAAVLAAQTAFLLFAGIGINSYTPSMYPTDPAIATLRHLVGSNLLGLDGPNGVCPAGTVSSCGVRQWTGIGLYPEMQLPYGIDELAVHDPLTPKSYFDSWPVAGAGQEAGGLNLFAPAVSSLALAERYGVRDLLVQKGTALPAGTRPIAVVEGPTKAPVQLVAVPGPGRFSFTGGGAQVLASSQPGDARYVLDVRVSGSRPQRLVLRITDAPGWHVSAGGRPLRVSAYDGAFLSVLVPPGTRTVTATYAPSLLGLGFVIALATVVALALAMALEAGAGSVLRRLVATRRPPASPLSME
jgi:hypothetical protein